MRYLLLCCLVCCYALPVAAAPQPAPCAEAQRLMHAADVFEREEGIYQLSITPGCRGALADDLARICGEDGFYNADFAYRLLRAYYRSEEVAAGRERLLHNFAARLRDPDPRTRLEAAERLGKLKRDATPVLPELLALCRDDDAYVAKGAAKAIRAIDGDSGSWFLSALRTLVEHRNGNVQIYALRLIAKQRLFDEQTLTAVRRLDDEALRKNVRRWKLKVLSLAQPGAPAAAPETLEVDDDGDE